MDGIFEYQPQLSSAHYHKNLQSVSPHSSIESIEAQKIYGEDIAPAFVDKIGSLIESYVVSQPVESGLSAIFDMNLTSFPEFVANMPHSGQFELIWGKNVYSRLRSQAVEEVTSKLVQSICGWINWELCSARFGTKCSSFENRLTVLFSCLALTYHRASSICQTIPSNLVSLEELMTWTNAIHFSKPEISSCAMWLCFEYQKNQKAAFDPTFISLLLNRFLQITLSSETTLSASDEYPSLLIALDIICMFAKFNTNLSVIPSILDLLNQVLIVALESPAGEQFGWSSCLVCAWACRAISSCCYSSRKFISADTRLESLRHTLLVLKSFSPSKQTLSHLHASLWALKAINFAAFIKNKRRRLVDIFPDEFRARAFPVLESYMEYIWKCAVPYSFDKDCRLLNSAAIQAITTICEGSHSLTKHCSEISMGTLVHSLDYWISLFPSFFYFPSISRQISTLSHWIEAGSTKSKIEIFVDNQPKIGDLQHLQQRLGTIFSSIEVETLYSIVSLLLPTCEDMSYFTNENCILALRSIVDPHNFSPWDGDSPNLTNSSPPTDAQEAIYLLCRTGLMPSKALLIVEQHIDHLADYMLAGPVDIISRHAVSMWIENSDPKSVLSMFRQSFITRLLPPQDGKDDWDPDVSQFFDSWESLTVSLLCGSSLFSNCSENVSTIPVMRDGQKQTCHVFNASLIGSGTGSKDDSTLILDQITRTLNLNTSEGYFMFHGTDEASVRKWNLKPYPMGQDFGTEPSRYFFKELKYAMKHAQRNYSACPVVIVMFLEKTKCQEIECVVLPTPPSNPIVGNEDPWCRTIRNSRYGNQFDDLISVLDTASVCAGPLAKSWSANSFKAMFHTGHTLLNEKDEITSGSSASSSGSISTSSRPANLTLDVILESPEPKAGPVTQIAVRSLSLLRSSPNIAVVLSVVSSGNCK